MVFSLNYLFLLQTILWYMVPYMVYVQSLEETSYIADTTVVATVCPEGDIIFEVSNESLIGCAVLCSSNSDCTGVFHTDNTGACVGCRLNVNNVVGSLPLDTGTRYFKKDCQQDSSWSYFSGSNYKLYQLNMTFAQAKVYCEEQCGYLVHINDNDELQFVKAMANRKNVTAFIGLEFDVGTDVWGWTDDGAPLTLADWSNGEPNNPDDEHCVALHKGLGFAWVDIGCDAILAFVCEKQ